MDLRTLRYFVATAQELNITRAAEKLNMSQPPLSNQIRGLEEELGVRLFLRGKRRLTLTEEGTLLLRRAVQLLELADKTRQEVAALREGVSGTLCLSIVEGMAPYLTAEWIAGFREEFPLVRYSLWNGSSDDVLDRLRRGLADLAIIAAPYDWEHLEGFPVGSEPWVAILPEGHPLAKEPGGALPLARLAGEPLIVPSRKSRIEDIRQWFGGIGLEPRIICETSNYVDAVALAAQGVGVSIFPRTAEPSGRGTAAKVLTEPARQAEYVLVWNKGQRPAGLPWEFVLYVRDALEEGGGALDGLQPR